MDILRQWYIDGEDFEAGVDLLSQNQGNTEGLKTYCGQSYIPQSVRDVLEKRLNEIPLSPLTAPEWMPNCGLVPHPPKGEFPVTLDSLLKVRGIKLLKERDDARFKIRYEPDAAIRLALIQDLMERIVPELDLVYNQKTLSPSPLTPEGGMPLDNAPSSPITHDTSPMTYESGVREATAKMLKLQNMTSRVSKLRGMLAKPNIGEPEKAKYTIELQDKEAEILTIKTALGLNG